LIVWRTARALLRVLAFLVLNALLVPLYLAVRPTGRGAARALVRAYCRATCAILGIEIVPDGQPFRACPTLFVGNHVSYLDVVILGAILDAAFIAKLEVASWPLFGQLGRLTGTLFVRRHWREALRQRDAVAERLRGGQSLVLFAEGTSTDGLAVRRFKTSLLSVAEAKSLERPIAVQAVTLAFRCWADSTPIGPANCGLYAWYGEAEFVPHLWGVLLADGLRVSVSLGTPVLSWAVRNRKALAAQLHADISARLADRLRPGVEAVSEELPEPEPQPA
jgi:1-acyl-sn-glycerol-3-phosphate acyltransferase